MFKKASISLAVGVALFSGSVAAEGYKLYQQSVSAAGNAYAGRGAQVTDASLLYSNPAAITQLKGSNVSAGLTLIDAKINYTDAQAKSAQGMSVAGAGEGHISKISAVPFAFYTDHLNESISYGVGIFAPFGVSGDYDNDFVGRYFADKTEIKVLSLQPTVAYKLDNIWSIGFGLNINKANGLLSKFKDHSGLCELGPQRTQALLQGMDAFNSAYCDSHFQVEGKDTTFGYNLGLHANLGSTKLGFSYQSEVEFTLKGDSTVTNAPILGATVVGHPSFHVVNPALPAIDLSTGKFASRDLLVEKTKLDLTTPATATLSVDHAINPTVSLQASAIWTGWSIFKSIDIISDDDNPNMSLSTGSANNLNSPGYIGYIPEQWHDTWSFSLGATVAYNDVLTLKTGVMYDENPIQSRLKTARVPTTDRLWWNWGANWALSKTQSIDVSYSYMWMNKVTVNEREYNVQNQALYASGYQGNYSTDAQTLAVQWNYTF